MRNLTTGYALLAAWLSLPIAADSEEPTAAQLADLQAAIAQPGAPAGDRLKRAVTAKENEPLAREMVKTARRLYRQGERGNPLRNLLYYLQGRSGDETLLLDGAYLKDYSELLYEICEAELGGMTGWGLATEYRPLLLYLRAHPEDRDLRERTIRLARRFADISKLPPRPEKEKPGDSWPHRSWQQVSFSWRVLHSLGVLKDGMTFADAKAVLGAPTSTQVHREGTTYTWHVPTGFRSFTGIHAQQTNDGLKFHNLSR